MPGFNREPRPIDAAILVFMMPDSAPCLRSFDYICIYDTNDVEGAVSCLVACF